MTDVGSEGKSLTAVRRSWLGHWARAAGVRSGGGEAGNNPNLDPRAETEQTELQHNDTGLRPKDKGQKKVPFSFHNLRKYNCLNFKIRFLISFSF